VEQIYVGFKFDYDIRLNNFDIFTD
jgi:hypothetical protein